MSKPGVCLLTQHRVLEFPVCGVGAQPDFQQRVEELGLFEWFTLGFAFDGDDGAGARYPVDHKVVALGQRLLVRENLPHAQ